MSNQALTKAIGHGMKFHKSDCIGALLGKKEGNTLNVIDVVPLFHDRVMTSALETAMEIVEMYASSKGVKLIGFYDAPLKFKNSEISSLSQALGEQMYHTQQDGDVAVVSIRFS